MNEKFQMVERKKQLQEDIKAMQEKMMKTVSKIDANETSADSEMEREVSAKNIQQAQDGIIAVEKKIIELKEEISA